MALYTGIVASGGVAAGIMLTQGANQIWFNGRPYSELFKITGQLILSVSLADGAWLPLANLGLEAGPIGSWFALPVLFCLEAGLFSGAQYLMDKLTPSVKGQASFVPDAKFTAKIAGAYLGFHLSRFDDIASSGLGGEILASLVAGLGTMVIPYALGREDYQQARNVVDRKARACTQRLFSVLGAPFTYPAKALHYAASGLSKCFSSSS